MTNSGFDPRGAIDGNRFSIQSAWKGATNHGRWWWQIDFSEPRAIGAILQIATAGPGSKTKTQCLRTADFPIYGAKFHIEMEGTPAASTRIRSNFLATARASHTR